MKKVLASVALFFLFSGFMFGILNVCYAWAVWAMMGSFAVSAMLCIIVNEW